jgi:hypothetical protein
MQLCAETRENFLGMKGYTSEGTKSGDQSRIALEASCTDKFRVTTYYNESLLCYIGRRYTVYDKGILQEHKIHLYRRVFASDIKEQERKTIIDSCAIVFSHHHVVAEV